MSRIWGELVNYKIMHIDELSNDMILSYFTMLTPVKQNKISSMNNVDDRKKTLCSEILARQCLSKECNAPESSFQLLCNPDSKSVVGNFDAELSIVTQAGFVGCAASLNPVGMSMVSVEPFSFSDAQEIFTDTELRAVFSDSAHSFGELVNMKLCNEKSVMCRYALMRSLKEAHFYSTGRGIRTEMKKTLFEFTGSGMKCSDTNASICKSYIDINKNLAISIIERCKK